MMTMDIIRNSKLPSLSQNFKTSMEMKYNVARKPFFLHVNLLFGGQTRTNGQDIHHNITVTNYRLQNYITSNYFLDWSNDAPIYNVYAKKGKGSGLVMRLTICSLFVRNHVSAVTLVKFLVI